MLKKEANPMSEKKESRDYEKLLRSKAEKYLHGEKLLHKQIDEMSEKEIKTTFEELEVHKIELEMQNEELKIAQEQLEKSKQRYFDLYNFAPVGYLTIDNKGSITELNLTASSILKENRSSFIKKSLSKFIASEYEDAYYFFRNKILDLGETQSCDIQMLKKTVRFFGRISWVN
jgi:PAS domain-containing protein